MRTEDRVIPDLLCGRDEHLVRDTDAPELRGRQGAAATHRAASVAYAVSGCCVPGFMPVLLTSSVGVLPGSSVVSTTLSGR